MSGRAAGRVLIGTLLVMAAGQAAAGEWRLGIQGGAVSSGLSGDTPSGVSLERRIGPVVGLVVETAVADDVWLGIQPTFVRGGANSRLAVSGRVDPVPGPTLTLDYLSMPVLARVVADNRRTFVTGGVAPALLFGAELEDDGAVTDLQATFRDFALSAEIGFGVVFPARRAQITIELRYEQSILNLTSGTAPGGQQVLPERIRMTGFQLLAGFLWPL